MSMLTLMAHEVGIKPRFDLNWGLGFDFTKRITQSFPRDASARRIIIDFSSGGTSNVGLLYKTNTIAAGLALMRANTADRLLFAGGTTITGIAIGILGGKGGISKALPTMLGTYDPGDPNNEAKDYTLRTKFDMSTQTTPDCWVPAFTSFNGAIIYISGAANSKYYVIRNLDFSCDDAGCFGKVAIAALGNGSSTHDGTLIENCTFVNLINTHATSGQTTPIASSADATFSLDVTIRKCGFYGGIAVNGGPLGLNGQRRLKLHDLVLCRGGRPAISGRTAVDSGSTTPAFTSALGATSVGNVVTVNDTSTMLAGDRVVCDTSSGGTGAFWTVGAAVVSINSPITFTVDTTPLTTLAGCIVKAFHVGDDLLRHHYYIDSNTHGIEILRNVSMLENVNNKFTGGDYNIEAHWHIWEPIGFLTDPNSNDATGNSWPAGSIMYANGITQIGSDDVQYNSLQRGWGDVLAACANGSRITNGIYINQCNPNNSTSKAGIQISANGRAYQSYGQVDNSVFVSWGANDNTAVVNTIKSWFNNVTDDATGYLNTTNGSGSSMSSGSGNVNRTALANAAINNLLNITIEDTFRVSNVLTNTATVVNANTTLADKQATIRNIGALMASPAGLAYNWAEELSQVVRRPSGH